MTRCPSLWRRGSPSSRTAPPRWASIGRHEVTWPGAHLWLVDRCGRTSSSSPARPTPWWCRVCTTWTGSVTTTCAPTPSTHRSAALHPYVSLHLCLSASTFSSMCHQTCVMTFAPSGNGGEFLELVEGGLEYLGPRDLTQYFIRSAVVLV